MEAFSAAAEEAWHALKDGTNEKSWLVLSVLPNKQLELSGSGRCGLDRVKAVLRTDGIQFAVIRVYAVEPTVKQPKFALISWSGTAAPLKVKVAAASLKPFATKYFSGVHADFELESLDSLTEAEVIKRLSAARGSHAPSSWQFGTGNAGDLEEAEHRAALEVARIREEEERRAAEEAAAKEAEEKRLAVEREKKLKALPSRARMEMKRVSSVRADLKGFDFSDITSSDLIEKLSDVEAEGAAWFTMAVSDAAPRKFALAAQGKGGLAELAGALRDDEIQFGAFRVTAVDREGARMSLRARVVSFAWNGPAVNTRTRIRNRETYGAAKAFFEALVVLELQLDGDRSQLEPPAVVKALRAVSKAGEYKFGYYSIDERAEEYFSHLEAVKALSAAESARDAEATAVHTARAAAKAEEEAARAAAETARAARLAEEEATDKARRAAQTHEHEA